MFGKLSNPIEINMDEGVCKALIKMQKEANENFLEKDKREKLRGIFIYVSMNKTYGINRKLLHSVSIKDKEYYDTYPCHNDITYINCLNKCDSVKNNLECAKRDKRAVCLYRTARMRWIWEIIHLCNLKNENIKMWTKVEKDKTTGRYSVKKRFVWYKKDLANYVLVFIEKYRNGKLSCLEFITGYPLFSKRTEEQFQSQYESFCK